MKFKTFKLYLAILWAMAIALSVVTGNWGIAVIVGTIAACALNRPTARLCAVTLSVPEILQDVMEAFKLELPELFGASGFATDFSSKTAVLGDKITAHIDHVPLVGSYNANNGGFENASQDVTTIIEDVPVTLNQFPIVTVKIGWLTQLSSKIPLYKRAVRNYGFALAKNVIDTVLAQVAVGNLSNYVAAPLANWSLDTFDGPVRNQLNVQKASGSGRFAIIGTPLASQIGGDDRVRSSLFYGALNGDNGFRVWRNFAGFSWVREYPDLSLNPNANLLGFGGDNRSIVVASRQIDYSNAAEMLGIPRLMEFYPMSDSETGLNFTGVGYQKVGTGDVIVSCGMLLGVAVGNQGGAPGTITDSAGVRFVTVGP